jgi:hypothetical protein
MNLTELSTAEILAELEKRSVVVNNKDAVLVFGTIGIDGDSSFIEVFKEIKIAEDLHFITQASLRARLNSHRYYQGFYFKTTDFAKLEKNLNNDNKAFAKWVRETKSIKFIGL